jgi:two-component system, cell cycle sensor histidine kinase and response regulator CckA
VSATYFSERGGQFICFCLDLSDRTRSQEKLTLLGQLLDAAPVSIMIHDADGSILFANRATLTLHGYDDRDELLALNLHDLDAATTDSQRLERLHRLSREGEARFEAVHFRKDGSMFPMDILVKVVEWEGVPSILSIGTDIAERKKAEETLAHSHYLMRFVIEHSNSAVAIHDRDLRYIYASQRYLDDFEVADRSIVGKHHSEVFPELPMKWRDAHQKALHGEITRSELDSYTRKDGSLCYTRWECRPWFSADGSIGGIIAYTEDITGRKNLEEQLQQAQKLESIGRLAGGVAHDFNNMLGVILGHAELVLEDLPNDSGLRSDIEEIQKAAQRSANRTRQMLAFARRQTIIPKILNLNETVESMLKMLRRLIGENVELAWEPALSLDPILIDPVQVDQVLANLIVNSRDAIGHSPGRIIIRTGLDKFDEEFCTSHAGFFPGRYVMLSVCDNGCGMDAVTKEQVFEPFFTTKPVGEGTGLGLATVYGIVKQNYGFIDLESEPGKGTILRIYLPVQISGPVATGIDVMEATSKVNGGETILLVEDEPTLLALTEKMLQRLDYNVLSVSSPEEALRIAMQHPEEIHLLITDVVMPRMNGRELSQSLASSFPNLKYLFMSGYAADIISRHGMDEEAGFIPKPFTIVDLGIKIREVLDKD